MWEFQINYVAGQFDLKTEGGDTSQSLLDLLINTGKSTFFNNLQQSNVY